MIVDQWVERFFTATPATRTLQALQAGSPDGGRRAKSSAVVDAPLGEIGGGWKEGLGAALGGLGSGELIDLTDANDEAHGQAHDLSGARLEPWDPDPKLVFGVDAAGAAAEQDHEAALANLPFEVHAGQSAGAFHAFSAALDGQCAKVWGHHRVRECHGSVQQWQCAAPRGPCREGDVWEAPDGFAFHVVDEPQTAPQPPPLRRLAPAGPPLARPRRQKIPL